MYAFVSNEYRTIVYTQRQLDFLCGIYSYPSFKKVQTEQEALAFFANKNREYIDSGIKRFGKNSDIGYVSVEYFIANNNIYVNVNTKRFGFIKLYTLPSNVKQDSTYDLLKLKICNVHLDDKLIAHHCIAILNILNLLDDCMNVELVVPDISVFLACTKYKGKNHGIVRLQSKLKSRLGQTFYTIR